MDLHQVIAPRLATASYPLTIVLGDEVVEADVLEEADDALTQLYVMIEENLGILEGRAVAAEREAIAAVEHLIAGAHELFSLADAIGPPGPAPRTGPSFTRAAADFDHDLALARRLVPEGTAAQTLRLARFLLEEISAEKDGDRDRDHFMLSLLLERTLASLTESQIGSRAVSVTTRRPPRTVSGGPGTPAMTFRPTDSRCPST
jgi:hypothetical protein